MTRKAGRPRQEFCRRGHPLADAHIVMTEKGIKRTCRKCAYIRHKSYYGMDQKSAQQIAQRIRDTVGDSDAFHDDPTWARVELLSLADDLERANE